MHHCAFEHDSFDDLMTSFDRLRKAGINTISIMRAEVRFASDSDRTAEIATRPFGKPLSTVISAQDLALTSRREPEPAFHVGPKARSKQAADARRTRHTLKAQ
jgi:hypothetical protein